jgi:hypothetical protein
MNVLEDAYGRLARLPGAKFALLYICLCVLQATGVSLGAILGWCDAALCARMYDCDYTMAGRLNRTVDCKAHVNNCRAFVCDLVATISSQGEN